ncbi:MAG: ABC transporter substrate-binding protein [Rhodospirillales bacterium]|nr:ABC transporter substrate-binding protein [Rhodospirillales bacterium]
MQFLKKLVTASAAAIVAAGLAAGPAVAATKVNYLLPAPGFLPAFGPWQLAKYKGFYAEEGLDVTFQTSKGGVDVAKHVGVGNAPIGGAIGDTSILVRPNGIAVRSVALIGGGSLVQVVARADRGIEKVEDLKGKTISVMSFQDTTFFASQGILASRGLSRNDVNIQAAGPQGVWKLFIAGKVDAMMGVPDWIGIARGAKVKMKIFNAMDYFPSMAQAIVASDEMIKKNPKLIQGLVRATLKGLKMIMDNPAAAAAEYVKAVPRWKVGPMTGTFKLYNKYTYPGQKVLGEMDAKRLATLQNFYFKAGFIKKKSPVEDLYTNQFVN